MHKVFTHVTLPYFLVVIVIWSDILREQARFSNSFFCNSWAWLISWLQKLDSHLSYGDVSWRLLNEDVEKRSKHPSSIHPRLSFSRMKSFVERSKEWQKKLFIKNWGLLAIAIDILRFQQARCYYGHRCIGDRIEAVLTQRWPISWCGMVKQLALRSYTAIQQCRCSVRLRMTWWWWS